VTRTERELKALRSEERLRQVLNLPPRPGSSIHGPGKRTPEENAALICDLKAKLEKPAKLPSDNSTARP
jgi:hypothetical protein